MREDNRVDPKNLFAVGFSNGGYWASYLAAGGFVNAGVTHYGVWWWPKTHNGYPVKYFSEMSNPVLALIGKEDTVQKYKFVMPEVKLAKERSQKFEFFVFKQAGHSWDCKPCKKDGFSK
ncbi:MAG: dienelactone hydrolase [Paracoccaceae bacterium]|jgi:dienelactone hydrolase